MFMTCPRKYFYAYEKRLESPGYNKNFGLGSLCHAYAEHFSGKGRPNIIEATLDEIICKYPNHAAQIGADVELSKRMMNAWHSYWSQAKLPFSNAAFEWLLAENEWGIKIEDNIHVGKSDGVVRHKEWNKPFYYELKTAADRDRESYVHRLEIDKQVSSNLMALASQGIPVAGTVYDVVWKPSLRRLTGRKTMPDETEMEFAERVAKAIEENPAKYFERYIVYRSDKAIEAHKVDLSQQFDALQTAREKKAWYRNSGACDNFGTLCPYFSLCMEGHEELETMFNTRDRKLPELSKEIQK